MTGRVVVVGTPIGNLGDLAPRAVEALVLADVVACEDTRRTGRLLQYAGVTARALVRLDANVEHEVAPQLVERAAGGETVAVVSDAGLPGLADPGAVVVRLAHDAGVPVVVVPGPFAGAVAAVASGLLDGSGRFSFEGFLPRRGRERSDRIADLAGDDRPVVIYEAPHRVQRTVGDLADACGADRRVALCRELTKLHETVWRGTLAEAGEHLVEVAPRGEYVLVVDAAAVAGDVDDAALVAAFDAEVAAGATRRDAAVLVARRFAVPPNRVKRLVAR
jgi:16S rRNA (cytidine1402-2'-O)-methyltransferase